MGNGEHKNFANVFFNLSERARRVGESCGRDYVARGSQPAGTEEREGSLLIFRRWKFVRDSW